MIKLENNNMSTKGKIVGVNGNMVSVQIEDRISMNEVGFVLVGDKRLKAEVIRIKGSIAQMQVFEMTKGIRVGDTVEFSNEMLAVDLGPGLMGRVYDGLQNPLPELAEEAGFFLERGIYLNAINQTQKWSWTPSVAVGDTVVRGDSLGFVPEGVFEHQIMLPFNMFDTYTVKKVTPAGEYTVKETMAVVADSKGTEFPLTMIFQWPVKRAITCYEERLRPTEPMVTQIRLVDTFLPVAKGGTYCIPGPFGAGKTVLQHSTSRNADVDVVIVAACGERAGEVVETLKEFPELTDPRTGKSLMERTIIICNTSSMPVASREASVYTAITMAEYYRQMGLDVLLLADSTSRWAQAMREMSGRLEEIPGEEAFPAYLESTIATFYERAGIVRLKNGKTGSVTVGGTVSPAGGNFEEPVTQGTLKVVGAFHGLSRERSDARKYPAIHPIDSWSKYQGIMDKTMTDYVYGYLKEGYEVEQMMKVVGEEGTSLSDYIIYLKGQYIDAVYFQQNSFDMVDAAVSVERQKYSFGMLLEIVSSTLALNSKEEARDFFNTLRLNTLDFNSAQWMSEGFKKYEASIRSLLTGKKIGFDAAAKKFLDNYGVKN